MGTSYRVQDFYTTMPIAAYFSILRNAWIAPHGLLQIPIVNPLSSVMYHRCGGQTTDRNDLMCWIVTYSDVKLISH